MFVMPTYFDTHSHLNFPQYDRDRAEVLARMEEYDIATVIVGTDAVTSKEAIALAETNERLFASIGVHPADDDNAQFDQALFENMVSNKKVVAIGEVGLDYFHSNDKERQKRLFIAQTEFAVKHDVPLIIHCREAYEDVLGILEGYRGRVRGNVHFFAGSIEIADRVLDLGFNISFPGVITFTREYDEVVRYIPADRIMAETDSPYVAPVPHRGERNEPLYVRYVYQKIAEIRGEEEGKMREILTENALRFFRII